jgi:hypothetical protein
MENELKQALEALGGGDGIVVQIMAWMAAARLICKVFSERLKAAIESSQAANNPFVAGIIESGPWKVFAFFVDLLSSIKLPIESKPKPGADGP